MGTLIDLLTPRQMRLGYRALLSGGKVEVWHGSRLVCSLPATASARVIRGTVWQDSFLNHLLERGWENEMPEVWDGP